MSTHAERVNKLVKDGIKQKDVYIEFNAPTGVIIHDASTVINVGLQKKSLLMLKVGQVS